MRFPCIIRRSLALASASLFILRSSFSGYPSESLSTNFAHFWQSQIALLELALSRSQPMIPPWPTRRSSRNMCSYTKVYVSFLFVAWATCGGIAERAMVANPTGDQPLHRTRKLVSLLFSLPVCHIGIISFSKGQRLQVEVAGVGVLKSFREPAPRPDHSGETSPTSPATTRDFSVSPPVRGVFLP